MKIDKKPKNLDFFAIVEYITPFVG
nr:glycosyltransferase family 25 [Sicyoidochytrium minutum DNA virus]